MADDLASTLAAIREDNERVIALCAIAPAAVKQLAEHDVPALLAAIEAVLELADRYDTIPAYGPTPAIRHQVARSFREAITRELTGKEAGE